MWAFPRLALLMPLICIVLAAMVLPARAGAAAEVDAAARGTEELVLFTWADYVDPGVVADFEREHGVRLRQVHYENDEVRDQVMGQSGGAGFDVLLVDGTGVEAYLRRGWIVPIAPAAAPNLTHLDPRWMPRRREHPGSPGSRGPEKPGDTPHAAVPYVWGTLGIAYRRDLIGQDMDSWMDLLRPAPELRGRILMSGDSLDLVGMALKALGHSMNSGDPGALAQASELLLAQQPAVRRYGALGVDEDSELLRGEVVAAMTYNGDAAALMEHNPAVIYLVPREGGALWVDYLAVAAASTRKALGIAFIDYMNRPEVAARNAQGIYYATPNRAAEALLPESYLADPLVYPDAETLERCEVYQPLAPEALRARVQAYSRIVHGG